MFLLAIIEKETPEASKTTLLRLCQTAWNWDFEFLIIFTQITTMKCLSIMKQLSINLQKQDIDVSEAYSHIKDWLVGNSTKAMSKQDTPKDYYKRALTIPLLDYLISEIDIHVL